MYCVDVPLEANAALSLMVSGKPSNEALIHETFQSVLSSLGPQVRHSPIPILAALLGVALLIAVGFGAWRGIGAIRRR